LFQFVVKPSDWLDIDAGPATVIKEFGDAVLDRIIRADVDIEPILHRAQSPVKQNVLKISAISDKQKPVSLAAGLVAA
jgi:hypothetical protein